MPSIVLEGVVVPYQVEVRPRRQRAAIQINAYHQVTVLLPSGYPPSAVESLIRNKSRWVLAHLAKPIAVPPVKQFLSGEEFLWQGDVFVLQIAPSVPPTPAVGRQGGKIVVASSVPNVRQALIGWYVEQATQVLTLRMNHVSRIMKLSPTRLKISEYKTRWGFCRSDGVIALNWRIVQAPLPVIDYVVVHELAHRRFPHHQAPFWQAVALYDPPYQEHKKWLAVHGPALQW